MAITILAVDDEPDLEFLLRQRLRKRIQAGEFEFLFANNGLEALEQLESHPDVAVVLADINMPRMDGLELLNQMTERYPLVRTIIISAYGDMKNIRAAMNRGAYDFLLKPIDFTDLEITLNRTIEHVQAIMADIAKREAVENKLLQLKKAVENMQLGVTVIDLNGKIRYTNPAEARMHGYTQEELLGKDIGIFAPPDLRQPMTLDQIKRWKGLIRESINMRSDGSRFPVWLMSEIVKDANDEPTAIVTSCEDITERKRAEAELARHREHLEELVRERTSELTSANEHLQQEIAERRKIEQELRATYEDIKILNDRLQAELALARTIQYSLLPPSEPGWSELDVVCYSIPAYEVGGDFYTYYAFHHDSSAHGSAFPEGRYALAVGDVSGKGMPAALLMAVSLASFQETIGQGLTPVDLLTHLDETIKPYNQTTLQNCAMLYVEICPANEAHSCVAHIVNAGCITPIVRRAQGDFEWIDVIGMPLGVGWGTSSGYQETRVTLQQGDMLILTSDGVVEAKNPDDEILGFERFEQAVMSGPQSNAADMLAHLQSHVTTFMGKAELHDDLTIVVVRV